jgi:hypothetical protein
VRKERVGLNVCHNRFYQGQISEGQTKQDAEGNLSAYDVLFQLLVGRAILNEEHVVPESRGNDGLILIGAVCQRYFDKEVERYVLDKKPLVGRVYL